MEPTEERPGSAVVVRDVGPSEIFGSTAAAVVVPEPPPPPPPPVVQAAAPTVPAAAPLAPAMSALIPVTEFKKKRGRPRKYDGQGRPAALSPMPISASIPLSGDYSGWNHNQTQGRATEPKQKKQKFVFDSPGQMVPYSAGAYFTPHLLTVNAGEDVIMKIQSFLQHGSQAICVMSASGSVSNFTLRQPNSSGGTLTYEGCFDLITLNGSFIATETSGTKSRSGGLSVSVLGPDGRVLGGGLSGFLVAATPVQVLVATFLPGDQLEQKRKKPRIEPAGTTTFFNSLPTQIIFGEGFERSYADQNLNFAPANTAHGSESKEVKASHCEVSC